MFTYKRTNVNDAKYEYEITIDQQVKVNSKKYILVGFTSHSRSGVSGHYVVVKCDTDGKPVIYISDSMVDKYGELYSGNMKWGRGVTSVIYRQKDSSVPVSPSGGGFKPRHNAITNHTTPKSKHNSSFKASSSKTKGKSHNRSHTQRVK
jgi:hypothetical protein